MRAACERIVEGDDVSRHDIDLRKRSSDCHRHRSEMHRHVIALRDHAALRIEDSARIIASLFDVGRERGATQRDAHLICYRSEQRAINLERRWIKLSLHQPTVTKMLP